MKNNTATAHLPNKLRSDLRALISGAEKLITDTASEPSEDLHARFDAARKQVSKSYTEAKDQVVARAKSANATIRENPYQSLAITLGVGVLVGLIFKSCRK